VWSATDPGASPTLGVWMLALFAAVGLLVARWPRLRASSHPALAAGVAAGLLGLAPARRSCPAPSRWP